MFGIEGMKMEFLPDGKIQMTIDPTVENLEEELREFHEFAEAWENRKETEKDHGQSFSTRHFKKKYEDLLEEYNHLKQSKNIEVEQQTELQDLGEAYAALKRINLYLKAKLLSTKQEFEKFKFENSTVWNSLSEKNQEIEDIRDIVHKKQLIIADLAEQMFDLQYQ